MKSSKLWRLVSLFAALAVFVTACGGAATTAAPAPTAAPATQAPAATQPPAETPTEAAPTELNIAAIFSSSIEQPWITTWLQMIDRLTAEKPHGLTITVDYTESVAPPDAERVLREYAKTGKYEIIWAHSSYSDAVKNLKDEYPEILWAYSGSGNEPFGGNTYWVDAFIHEPAYLMGLIAGLMTETNTLGAVASFPYPNVNLPLNAFIEGARSVNPDVEVKVSYIEAWFDPPKAKEAAVAQITAGADFVYAERFGPFEAVAEKPGVLAFGHFADQASLAPTVVVTSTVALWDPAAHTLIDAWWDHVTAGVPYDGPMERIVYLMKDGGSTLAPYHGMESAIPQEVKDKVEQVKAEIMAGTFEVPKNDAPITSD